MASYFGRTVKVSTFGASHGQAIGGVVDGLPCGFPINLEALQTFLKRRAPGQHQLQTQRKEADIPEFQAGIVQGRLSGSPLAFTIQNTSQQSGDYDNLRDVPRPSHADYTARMRYGDYVDMRGGGHFSARITAPVCVAGGIAIQLLESIGIHVRARLAQVGPVQDVPVDYTNPPMDKLASISTEAIPMLDRVQRHAAEQLVLELKTSGDSTGGIVEVFATGLPVGMGNPNYDGIENRLGATLFGMPAVKGISFGSGFPGCTSRGSEQNDPFIITDEGIRTEKNNSGGIQGGITNGMPLVMQVGIKPTPSIYHEQSSVSLSMHSPELLQIKGRHDPCVALRAVPVVEALTALVLLDFVMEYTPHAFRHFSHRTLEV